SLALSRALFACAQLPQFFVELIDILKVPVDRGETDVGHVVAGFQPFHDQLADQSGLDLVDGPLEQLLLDLSDNRLDFFIRYRTFDAGQPDGAQQFAPVEGFDGAIAFDHLELPFFDVFVGREAAAARQALAPATHGSAFTAAA